MVVPSNRCAAFFPPLLAFASHLGSGCTGSRRLLRNRSNYWGNGARSMEWGDNG
jgi:hypothetical protein